MKFLLDGYVGESHVCLRMCEEQRNVQLLPSALAILYNLLYVSRTPIAYIYRVLDEAFVLCTCLVVGRIENPYVYMVWNAHFYWTDVGVTLATLFTMVKNNLRDLFILKTLM